MKCRIDGWLKQMVMVCVGCCQLGVLVACWTAASWQRPVLFAAGQARQSTRDHGSSSSWPHTQRCSSQPPNGQTVSSKLVLPCAGFWQAKAGFVAEAGWLAWPQPTADSTPPASPRSRLAKVYLMLQCVASLLKQNYSDRIRTHVEYTRLRKHRLPRTVMIRIMC